MSYYLGIDAGGTKTTGIIADEHTVLARATVGSIKVMRVSEAEAAANLSTLLRDISLQSGARMSDIVCTCVGMAGIIVPRVERWTRNTLQSQLRGNLLICGDEEVALDGAFFGEPGVLVVAGTGSIVVGRAQNGAIFHFGGWGPALSDEGSGYWIGLQAVRAILHANDHNIDTRLLPAVLHQWQISTHAELIEMGNLVPGPDFSQLAPTVAECANAGDAVALAVLEKAGRKLGEITTPALEKVRASAAPAEIPLQLAFTGSVLGKIPQVRDALVATVRHTFPEVTIHLEPVDAAMGALWRARQWKKLSTP